MREAIERLRQVHNDSSNTFVLVKRCFPVFYETEKGSLASKALSESCQKGLKTLLKNSVSWSCIVRSYNFEIVGNMLTGWQFCLSRGSFFLKMGMTWACFRLFGNTWLSKLKFMRSVIGWAMVLDTEQTSFWSDIIWPPSFQSIVGSSLLAFLDRKSFMVGKKSFDFGPPWQRSKKYTRRDCLFNFVTKFLCFL